MKLERKQFEIEIKADSDDGTITGYGSIFGNEDLGGDVVEKGAFAESIKAQQAKGKPLPMLWQHNPDWPIGRWDSVTEDQKGLVVTGKFNLDISRGAEVYSNVKFGASNGMSIGYNVQEGGSKYDSATGVRRLTKLGLHEVSLVTFPMNTEATVTGMKAEIIDGWDLKEIERHMREAFGIPRTEVKRVINRLLSIGSEREAGRADDAEIKAGLHKLMASLKA